MDAEFSDAGNNLPTSEELSDGSGIAADPSGAAPETPARALVGAASHVHTEA